MIRKIWSIVCFPFKLARWSFLGALAVTLLHQAAITSTETLGKLPDGKTTLLAGRVERTQAVAGAAGGVLVLEDLSGFAEIAVVTGDLPQPGDWVVALGKKYDVEGKAVVALERWLVDF